MADLHLGFLPETYRMWNAGDRNAFFRVLQREVAEQESGQGSKSKASSSTGKWLLKKPSVDAGA
jgi:hypothetical protein